MRTHSLRYWIMTAFMLLILFLSILMGSFGFYLIRNEIIEKTQQQMTQNIKAARLIYEGKIGEIGRSLGLVRGDEDLCEVRRKADLDYIYLVEKNDFDRIKSNIAEKASRGQEIGGTRIISKEEILEMEKELLVREEIKVIDTPRARPRDLESLDSLMALEYARPIYDDREEIRAVLYGGTIINENYELVDRIKEIVFEDDLYRSKPVGTVTIFQGDVRVATNVLDEEGERAIGTRLSEKVYDNVFVEDGMWLDRAFVVGEWYLTAYEPIKNVEGGVIGVLYTGMLEQPFSDMARNVFLVFILITLTAVFLALILSLILTSKIVRPVKYVLDGIDKISSGDLQHRVRTDTALKELDHLALDFNGMAESLDKKNAQILAVTHKREALNKRYLDLIGFVSHELKGILASTVMNAYSVRDGFLGMVNFKQQKALNSITRNLDHLDATVKNFLNLSRIEKGELDLTRRPVSVKKDIFDAAVDTFQKQMEEKKIEVHNEIDPDLILNVDRDLMQVVANNLISNAVKYGLESGSIKLASKLENGRVKILVYNSGRQISEEERKTLFNRFIRLDSPETKKAKGTGLGLFITKEIVETHGGTITVEPSRGGNTFIIDLEREEK